MEYLDVVVDLETTGTQPEHTNIIQIAAVKFDLASGSVDPNVFNRCLFPSPNRFWCEDTRNNFWSKYPDQLEGIYARMQDPRRVMQDFVAWAGYGGSLRLWAKPTSFELPFISSYCREYEVQNPFHFRFAMDQNTFIRARHFPEPPPAYEKEIEFVGKVHDALDDCFHQMKAIAACYEATR